MAAQKAFQTSPLAVEVVEKTKVGPIMGKKLDLKVMREKAEESLSRGDNQIDYRGVSFQVVDNPRGWKYFVNGNEVESLEEVFNLIDQEQDAKS